MAESKDIEAREPTAEELLVLDLLYGELDGDAAERAQARVSAQPERVDELDGFRSVRALLRELPDEDPPQAVSARLLHAAAEAAPSRGSAATAAAAAGGGGILAKLFGLFRPLVASPALAAVTMLVLVAGIAGALYVSGGFRATEPSEKALAPMNEQLQPTTPDEATSAEPPAATESPVVGGESDNDPNAAAGDQVGRGARLDEGEIDLVPKAAPEPAEEAKDQKVQTRTPAAHRSSSSSTRAQGTTATGSMGGGSYGAAGKADSTKASSDGAARGPGGVKGSASDSPMIDAEDYDQGAAAPAQMPQAPPPPPAEAKPAPTTKKKAPAREKQKPADKSAEKSVMVQDLFARAVQAAKDGECEAVRSLGERIRSLDATYYAKVFATDKRLAACRAAPAKK